MATAIYATCVTPSATPRSARPASTFMRRTTIDIVHSRGVIAWAGLEWNARRSDDKVIGPLARAFRPPFVPSKPCLYACDAKKAGSVYLYLLRHQRSP